MHLLSMLSLEELSFGSPEWFWALLLLLPVFWLFLNAGRRRADLLSKILAPRLQQQLTGGVSLPKRNLRMALLLLSLALIVAALAKPRLGYVEQEIKSRGRDVIIAIDTSKSMLSTDTAPTRLGRAKLIAQDLLNLLKGDRIGLIAFAGDAFLQAPLTLDKGAVLTSIQDLDTSTIPKGGTDIASAIRMAIAAFGKGEGTSRALVLMTDGEELEESGVEAAREAAAAGIKIFTIGFGSAEGSLIPIKNEAGENEFVRDENGRPVNSKLDASRLTEIAKETGGFYLPYGQDAATIIYDKGIVPIDAQERDMVTSRKPIERYDWPATAALVLLAFWSVLGEGRRRRNAAAAMILGAGLAFCPTAAQAADSGSGITDYQQGNYQGALKDFEQRLAGGSKSSEIQFDAGAAAYKEGDYQKAATYFSEAMTSSTPKIRDAATYNLANSLVRTGEAAKEDEAKLSDWKNALQHYETVLKSTPGNTQAKENSSIVRKLIEDLKKQQQQKKNQQDKKDQKNDQKDKNKDQQKNDKSQGGCKDQNEKKDQKDQQQQQNQQGGDKNSDQSKKPDQNQNSQNQPQNQSNNDQQKNDQSGKDQQKPQDSKGSQNQQQKNGPQGQPTPTSTPSPEQGKGTGSEQKPEQQQQQGAQPQNNQPQGEKSPSGESAQPTPAPTPAEKKDDASGGEAQEKKGEEKPGEAEAAEAEEGKDGKMSPSQARSLLRSVQDEEAHQLMNQPHAAEQTLHDW
jgi:Ca-activated chloride channel family protein